MHREQGEGEGGGRAGESKGRRERRGGGSTKGGDKTAVRRKSTSTLVSHVVKGVSRCKVSPVVTPKVSPEVKGVSRSLW